jgi:hypothetical protein
MAEWIALIRDGGTVAVLVILAALSIRGIVQFGPAVTAREVLWRERFSDVVKDRDEWKAIAQALVPALEKLGDALEERNRRDAERHRSTDR